MNSFLNCFLLCCVLFFNVEAFDACMNYAAKQPVCIPYFLNEKSLGSCVLLNAQNFSNKKLGTSFDALALSCQHLLTNATYDFFGDRLASISFAGGRALQNELFGHFYNLDVKHYRNLIFSSHSLRYVRVNFTKNENHIIIRSPSRFYGNTYAECMDMYCTFCEPNIGLPIDISVLFAENVDTSFAKIHDLPTNEQVSSWKNRTCKATMYGYPASKECEYSISCEMKLTDCGNWFKSVEPIPSGFIDLHGMSGGPCFVDDVLCGVISGCDNQKRLCVRALTTDLVEAIKFGVERFMDK